MLKALELFYGLYVGFESDCMYVIWGVWVYVTKGGWINTVKGDRKYDINSSWIFNTYGGYQWSAKRGSLIQEKQPDRERDS